MFSSFLLENFCGLSNIVPHNFLRGTQKFKHEMTKARKNTQKDFVLSNTRVFVIKRSGGQYNVDNLR